MKTVISILYLSMCLSMLFSCASKPREEITLSGLRPACFRTEIEGKHTDLFTLRNKHGMEVCITNFGGRIVSVLVPDKEDQMRDVVLGFDSIQDYMKYSTDFGATIGRYANRIAHGRITIDGISYQLPQNNYGHCLHGGSNGFQYRVFDAQQFDSNLLELSYLSKDGEEGFPGNLQCTVVFTLTENNALNIQYRATTDQTTVVNMTNHSYFNLDRDPTGTNSSYLLSIDADQYTPVDSTFMTYGKIEDVEGTDLDFRQPTAIGRRINNPSEQLQHGKGYDHNWVLNHPGNMDSPCATLESLQTGIVLDVYTTEPGIQFYAGNFLNGELTGKKGVRYHHRAAVCLETQKYLNTPQWPTALLKPGEQYTSHCIFKFSVKR